MRGEVIHLRLTHSQMAKEKTQSHAYFSTWHRIHAKPTF